MFSNNLLNKNVDVAYKLRSNKTFLLIIISFKLGEKTTKHRNIECITKIFML